MVGINNKSEGFGWCGTLRAIGTEPLERVERETGGRRLRRVTKASGSCQGSFSETRLVCANKRSDFAQIKVSGLVIH
jgi:hypothetical protein